MTLDSSPPPPPFFRPTPPHSIFLTCPQTYLAYLALAALAAAALAARILWPRQVLLLDFVTYRPPDNLQVDAALFEKGSRALGVSALCA